MTMIRPRGGDFVYNDIELKIMHTDLIEAKKLGTDGVVFGCLTPNGWLDEEALELLIDTAEGLQITFHMAFDAIPESRQFEAIDWLADHGVHRIPHTWRASRNSYRRELRTVKNIDRLCRRPLDYFTRCRYFIQECPVNCRSAWCL